MAVLIVFTLLLPIVVVWLYMLGWDAEPRWRPGAHTFEWSFDLRFIAFLVAWNVGRPCSSAPFDVHVGMDRWSGTPVHVYARAAAFNLLNFFTYLDIKTPKNV